jgi:hypothetical protein
MFGEQTLINFFAVVLNTFKGAVSLLLGEEATERAIAVFTLIFIRRLAAFANVASI